MSKIVVDMMGGDLGPEAAKEGVRSFKTLHPETELILVGDPKTLADMEGYHIVPSTSVVKMDAGALDALRDKSSSMSLAIKTVIDEKADAVVSCGSTGAFLTMASLKLKKIKGVLRPALITSFPTVIKGKSVTILDIGASTENSAEELAQFALMGSLYSEFVNGVHSPKVALLANGSEAGKGTEAGKAAYTLIKQDSKIDFVGNREARDVMSGDLDCVVSDGYSGNVLLKATEGTAKAMSFLMKKAFKKNILTMLGYLFAKGGIKEMAHTMDYKAVGGALLLGVNGAAIKAHGNCDGYAWKSALCVADKIAKAHLVEKIEKRITNE